MKPSFSFIFGTLLVVLAFVAAEILAKIYSPEISYFILGQGLRAPIFFIAMAALAIIIPVWSTMFLLPFGVIVWGPFETALLCILGWWIGSIISFYIGRTYQAWILTKYPSFKRYEFIDTIVSQKYPSLSLIFLRMTLPVDILSYALGLFSHRISWKQNAMTTLIGITPFAFVFSYIGNFPPFTQTIIFTITALLFIIYFVIKRKR